MSKVSLEHVLLLQLRRLVVAEGRGWRGVAGARRGAVPVLCGADHARDRLRELRFDLPSRLPSHPTRCRAPRRSLPKVRFQRFLLRRRSHRFLRTLSGAVRGVHKVRVP